MGPASEDNPIAPDVCPFLCNLLASHAVPIDACLGISGLPQSATGQTTLFTGVNAPQAMGRHVEGFPGPTLRKIIERDNIFLMLHRMGLRSRFADAYLADSVDDIRNRRFRSVTTVAALTRPDVISLRPDLLANQAVCHDITREVLIPKGFSGPLASPEEAADHLVQLALGYDFTLFEFFQTDQAGHTSNRDTVVTTLRKLDAFLAVLCPLAIAMDMLVTITSDHGNIESLRSHSHTFNPVPLITLGPGAHPVREGATSLMDVLPRLLDALSAPTPREPKT